MTELRRIADFPSEAVFVGETLLYTEGCLDGKEGMKFYGCKWVCADGDEAAERCKDRFFAGLTVIGLRETPE